ncbi:MAG: hypothetical protein IKX70_00525 [Treponema sp.]|nr:hypothetical protein [Treponema sp.]
MTFFVISVLFVNLILWAIMLIRFKRLFSTDKIIEKTEQKLNHLIKEIDIAADRDTYLAKETSKRIKKEIEEAERKMELFQEATNRLRDMIAEADKINKGQKYTIKPAVDPDAAYEITMNNKKPEQGNLFEQNNDTYSNLRDKKSIDGAAVQEVPLVITKVFDEHPDKMTDAEKKKNLSMNVRRLFSEGLSADEISKKLNCSITEVQFIIDLL